MQTDDLSISSSDSVRARESPPVRAIAAPLPFSRFVRSVAVSGGRWAYELLHWWGAALLVLALCGVVVSVSLTAGPLWLAIIVVAAVLFAIVLEGAYATTVSEIADAQRVLSAMQQQLATVTAERDKALEPSRLALRIEGLMTGELNSELALQPTIRATNPSREPIAISEWTATLEYEGRTHTLRHMLGATSLAGSIDLPFLDRIHPLPPGQTAGLLLFVTPRVRMDPFIRAVSISSEDSILLSVRLVGARDQEWATTVDVRALAQQFMRTVPATDEPR
jgi:hypothetical protein